MVMKVEMVMKVIMVVMLGVNEGRSYTFEDAVRREKKKERTEEGKEKERLKEILRGEDIEVRTKERESQKERKKD